MILLTVTDQQFPKLQLPRLRIWWPIKLFFKEVYGLRPNVPKYSTTKDISAVLNYVRNLPNDEVSLELLSQNLAVPLALTTGQR